LTENGTSDIFTEGTLRKSSAFSTFEKASGAHWLQVSRLEMILWSVFIGAVLAITGAAESTFKPLRPPAIPLAVRSPYLSTWQQAGQDGGNGGYLQGQWPTFWQ
jgi:hypothetical protein